MRRDRKRRSGLWNGAGAALLGLAAAVLTACGGTDSRQEVRTEGEPESSPWQTGVSSITVDSAPPAAPAPVVDERRAVSVSFEEAEAVFRTGDYLEAADLFESYAERRPENPWGHYMVGISAWRAGDHGRAEDGLRRALESDPQHRKGLLNLSRVLLERGKAHDALEPIERLVELEPRSGEGWRVLGNVRSSLGQVELAEEAYREALALNELDSWTMNNLGLLRIRAGRYEEALGPLARATQLRPEVARFQNNLGIALERSGYLQEASEAFRAALESDSGHERAAVSLERMEERLPGQLQVSIDRDRLSRDFESEIARWREARETTRASGSPARGEGLQAEDRAAPEPRAGEDGDEHGHGEDVEGEEEDC